MYPNLCAYMRIKIKFETYKCSTVYIFNIIGTCNAQAINAVANNSIRNTRAIAFYMYYNALVKGAPLSDLCIHLRKLHYMRARLMTGLAPYNRMRPFLMSGHEDPCADELHG